jgi:DNA-binding beta-propeller fold protein YncE
VGGGSAVAVVGGAVYVTSFPDGLGQYFTPQIYPYKKDSLGGQGCQSFENLP